MISVRRRASIPKSTTGQDPARQSQPQVGEELLVAGTQFRFVSPERRRPATAMQKPSRLSHCRPAIWSAANSGRHARPVHQGAVVVERDPKREPIAKGPQAFQPSACFIIGRMAGQQENAVAAPRQSRRCRSAPGSRRFAPGQADFLGAQGFFIDLVQKHLLPSGEIDEAVVAGLDLCSSGDR